MMDEQAQAAIQGLNGQMLDGKTPWCNSRETSRTTTRWTPVRRVQPVRRGIPGIRSVRGRRVRAGVRGPAVAAQYAAYYGYAAQQGATGSTAGANAAAAGGDEAANAAAWAAYYASYGYAMPGAEAAAGGDGAGAGRDGWNRRGGGGRRGRAGCRRRRGPPEGAFAVGDPRRRRRRRRVRSWRSRRPRSGGAAPSRRGRRHGDVERQRSRKRRDLPCTPDFCPFLHTLCLSVRKSVVLEAPGTGRRHIEARTSTPQPRFPRRIGGCYRSRSSVLGPSALRIAPGTTDHAVQGHGEAAGTPRRMRRSPTSSPTTSSRRARAGLRSASASPRRMTS